MPVRIVSWNVNGLRSCISKGFLTWLAADRPDVVCLQEVRTSPEKLVPLEAQIANLGYHCLWHPAERKGYSGTAVLSRFVPLAHERGLAGSEDVQGRALTADFGSFKIASLYGPNSSPGTSKIPIKQMWLRNLRDHAEAHADTPLILCGDLNVAVDERDSQGVTAPLGFNGCTHEEREGLRRLFDECDFYDPARDAAGDALLSSWWSPYEYGRKGGNGIRLDYALIGNAHRGVVTNTAVHPEVQGSDHCPVSITVDLPTAHLQPAVGRAAQKMLL